MTANLGLHFSHVTKTVFLLFLFFVVVVVVVFMTRLIYERMYAYSRFPLSEQKIKSVKVYQ